MPLASSKESRSRRGEHTPSFIRGGEEGYLQGLVKGESHRVGGFRYKADKGIDTLHPPQPWDGSRGEQLGLGKNCWGRTVMGSESLGWGAQGLVNIDHSQKGMGMGEGSPYISSQG